MRRIVDAVFIENQRVGQRADLQQAMPVHRVSRQARDFQAEHDAGAAQADFGHQPLESFAIGGRGARLAQISIDDDDAVQRASPARRRAAGEHIAVCVLSVFSNTCRSVDWRT